MSYFGGVVLARSDRPLTAEPAIEGFGIHHRWLRDLGGGWQVLETSRPESARFDYLAAAHAWCASTGTPVLAAHVAEGYGAALLAAAPDGTEVRVHLPDPAGECDAFRHPYPTRPVARADALDALAGWARAAGLRPDLDHLAWALGPEPTADSYLPADDLVFELVLALGFAAIPAARDRTLDPEAAPYHEITAQPGGLAWVARIARAHGETLPGWADDAITLDERIWRASFAHEPDTGALLADVATVAAAHRADREGSDPPPEHVEVGGRRVVGAAHLAETMRTMRAGGQLLPPRRYDRRVGRHPVTGRVGG